MRNRRRRGYQAGARRCGRDECFGVVEPHVFADARGYFMETYNADEFVANGIPNVFVQDNQSMSSYGVVRGLHCQTGVHAQAKLVRVLQGAVLDVAVDIRPGSPTFGRHVAVELSAENKRQLFIPRGFLHGFSVLTDVAVFAYKCDNLYAPGAEFGVRFDDPDIGIDWKIPADKIIVSDKDRKHGVLKDATDYGL